MKKLCQPSPPVRRHRTLKKPSTHETSKLEEKLDGLVTLLKSATQGMPGLINPDLSHGDVFPATSENAPATASPSGASDAGFIPSKSLSNGGGLPEPTYTPTTTNSLRSMPLNDFSLQPDLHPALEPSAEDAELYLNKFRNDFVKHLPFIIIPPSVTSHQLRQDRPILWIAIMTVSSSNIAQQHSLSKEMREILARHAFVQGTRNMDFLLAVLVYATWDRGYCFGKPVLLSLLQLAIAILYDLELDKAPLKDPTLAIAYDLKGITKPTGIPRTLEERRAFLGCFLMSSVTCTALRKGSPLRWTAYSAECLRIIETEKEYETDELLIQLVKLRLICGRVRDFPWSSVVADTTTKAPAMFYLKSLEAELQDFKSNIPNSLSNNKALLIALHSTELTIYEVGLSQSHDNFNKQENRRIECLWACFNAVKSLFDVFLDISPAGYVGFSSMIYSNILQGLLVMQRLSTFEHAEWDRALVREHLNVSAILEESEKRFALVKEAAGLDDGGATNVDSFTDMASRVRFVKMLWYPTNAPTMAASDEIPSGDQLYDFQMEFSDPDWLRFIAP